MVSRKSTYRYIRYNKVNKNHWRGDRRGGTCSVQEVDIEKGEQRDPQLPLAKSFEVEMKPRVS